MSGELLARLKAERPDIDWDARIAEARKRQQRERRNPWNKLRHLIHLQMHRDSHRNSCTCKGGRFAA